MSFSRDAAEILRAAEGVLSGRRSTMGDLVNVGETEEKGNPYGARYSSLAEVAQENDRRTLELLRQLQGALSEIVTLRAELSAEKESRGAVLAALGRRWKEEVLVELRGGDHQLRCGVAELQLQLDERLKEQATQHALLRRQVDELVRGAKARDYNNFDHQEKTHEELQALRTRVDAAMAQSVTTRVECAQQVEREMAAHSHRLDVELVRFAEVREGLQREVRAARDSVHAEIHRVGGTVKALVEDAWRSCAAALEGGAREYQETTLADLKRTRAAVQAMEEKVEGCVRTCQAEGRLLGAALRERVGALESNEAVTAARVDRAEKKSDAAHDTTTRMDAAFLGLRETVERAAQTAQRAAERAQRAEDALTDRDSRLAQVEAQLQATTTAEGLRAEIEACKRATARVEGQVGALSRVCDRAEAMAEAAAKNGEAAADRAARCERLQEKAQETARGFAESQQQWVQRVAAVEDVRDRVAAAVEQQERASARTEQRMGAVESRLQLLGERQSELAKEAQRQYVSLAAQLESSQGAMARGESISAAARAEVERLEKRLMQVEAAGSAAAADSASARTAVEDNARDIESLRRQIQQAKELQDARGVRVEEKLDSLDRLESTVTERIGKMGRHVNKQLDAVAQRSAGASEQLQNSLQDSFTQFQLHVEKEIGRNIAEMQRRIREGGAEYASLARADALEAAVAALRRTSAELVDRLAPLEGLPAALTRVEAEARRRTTELTRALQEAKAVGEEREGRQEGELQRLQRRLQAVDERTTQSSVGCEARLEAVNGRQQQLEVRVGALAEAIARGPELQGAGSADLPAKPIAALPTTTTTTPATTGKTAAAITLRAPLAATPAPRSHTDGSVAATTAQAEEELAAHVGSLSPVDAAPALAGTSPGSSLAHVVAPSPTAASAGARRGHLFPSTDSGATGETRTSTTSSTRDRARSEEREGQGSALLPSTSASAGPLAATVGQTTSAPKRLPLPTTRSGLPDSAAASAETTLVGGGGTAAQRTQISRFMPVDDDETSTSPSKGAAQDSDTPRARAGVMRGSDWSSSLTANSPLSSPHRRTAAAAAKAAWAQPTSSTTLSVGSAGGNETDAYTRTVERQGTPWDGHTGSPLVMAGAPSGHTGDASSRAVPAPSERADPPQASTHRFDDWDDEVDDEEDGNDRIETDDDDDNNNDNDSVDDARSHHTESDALAADAVRSEDLPMGEDESVAGESEDAVLPADAVTPATPPRARQAAVMRNSPDPQRPSPATGLRATPRKDFLGTDQEDPLDGEEVPLHGRATTSSSTTTGASAARASSGSQEVKPVRPAVKKYAYFDDSSSSDGGE